MYESAFANDDILIDRLVDGELSGDEHRELLASLDLQPGGWRKCALAFVESQMLRQELRQFVAPTAGDVHAAVQACIQFPSQGSSKTSPARRGWRHGGAWLAIAASLLMAFGLGRHFGLLHDAATNEITGSPIAVAGHPGLAAGDAVTLVVNDQGGRPQRIRVPLVEGRRLGAQFADTPGWSESPELTRQLNEQGLGLTARRRYAPMYFEQQNQLVPMVVPVDDAVVTPVSNPVF